jgi:Phytanoyl-CoA dioxygenase (PhyH)
VISVDTGQLEENGYVIIPKVLNVAELFEFESMVASFASSQAKKLGLTQSDSELFIDVFRRGGPYTERIYLLMERMFILHKITVRLGEELDRTGFLDWAGIQVPLIWPDIRADVPGDSERALPVHQDFGSTFSERAWRFWIPLRPSDAFTGSMLVYPGTHKGGPREHNVDNPLKPYVDSKHYAGTSGVILEVDKGDGVIMSPLMLHASVPNHSHRTKFTLMVQIQDYNSVLHPNDRASSLSLFESIASLRAKARAQRVG